MCAYFLACTLALFYPFAFALSENDRVVVCIRHKPSIIKALRLSAVKATRFIMDTT
jgi:hypothetical protein